MSGLVHVVLAGGRSRRFGADKLSARLDGRSLLEVTLSALPSELPVFVVGPVRPSTRHVTFVREHPPGGGPGSALLAGLRHCRMEHLGSWVGVVPGDAPSAGHALVLLRQALERSPGAVAAVGVDAVGALQPLHLVLTPAGRDALLAAGTRHGGAAPSARGLVAALDPLLVPIEAQDVWDVDEPVQLAGWQHRDAAPTRAVLERMRALAADHPAGSPPLVVCLDGPSGAGKSTLANALAVRTGAVVLEGDGFYSPRLGAMGLAWARTLSEEALVEEVIDWRRLRAQGLEPLLAGREARYHPYDWDADDGSLGLQARLAAGPLVVLEGVYSARPELRDLVDLTVYVQTPEPVLAARLAAREQDDPGWAALWRSAERHYFRSHPRASYDLVVQGSAVTLGP